mmetsp:Transcript_28016/g.43562  ORF Transcript_28016/g.43562 Transcript_28016/m.43562 type:complete len:526 (+) Transcript_28016:137-1714(+)
MVLSLRKEHHRQQPANMTTIIAILFFAASMANVLLMVSSFPLFHPPANKKSIIANIREPQSRNFQKQVFVSSLMASNAADEEICTDLTADQLDFTMGYLNKHHSDLLTKFSLAFTELGREMKRKNGLSGGSFMVESAKMVHITREYMSIDVTVNERGKDKMLRRVTIDLDSDLHPSASQREYSVVKEKTPRCSENAVDDVMRRLIRLCQIVKQPEVTGKLIQLGIQIGGKATGRIEENLYLNNVPHNRLVRKYFYDMACRATLDAVILCSEGKLSNRMQITCLFPELNTAMDAYRVGTLLEMARALAITLAEQNLRVRVCVQGSMGVGIFTAIPKQLSGVATLLQRMDWQSGEGEENEGMVGTYVNFGGVGKEHVVNAGVDRRGNKIEQDDVFIIICPQSMVGQETSIYGPLSEMVAAAGDRPVILLNPDLTDKISSGGQQSVRGRSERIAFQNSFKSIYHFQCTYISGTSYFPIFGALGKFGPTEPWIAYHRRDRVNNGGEIYIPIVAGEDRPESEVVMKAAEI